MRNYRAILLAFFVGLGLSVLLEATARTDEKPAAKTTTASIETVKLFDGKSLDGWGYYLIDPEVKMEDVWSVRDGMIVCKGKPMGYLATKKDYTNFRLLVEWRYPPGVDPTNSGVLMRINGDPKGLPRCVEAQLKHKSVGDFWAFDGFKISGDPKLTKKLTIDKWGKLTGIAKTSDNEKPAGEWNTYEIIADGPTVTLIVNGKQVNQATDCEITPGAIGLQSEGGEIHFRKVELTPIIQVESPKGKTVDLLEDETLADWDFFLRDRKDKTKQDTTTKKEQVWSVADGVLSCKGKPIGYLRTKAKYDNYILELQWRWPENTKRGSNNGVLLRAHGEEKVWPKSLEAQLKTENAGDVYTNHDFAISPVTGQTDGRRTQKLYPHNEKPFGQWNDYQLIMDGDVLILKVNGMLQTQITGV
ncbi:MAG: DUF1080 domain-containing protein, partial [Planctomycetota bacterium]|nr:DUF1080 domain-containing protein [Planctomycetota bacterium]